MRRLGPAKYSIEVNFVPNKSGESVHKGHRNRLRARFLREGLASFEHHNMLELLLFYAVPRRDTNELAHRLIDRYGSLSGVFDADVDELVRGAGLSESTAALIKLVPALAREYLLDRGARASDLDSFEKIGAYLCDYFMGFSREVTVVMPISAGGSPGSPVAISEGTPDGCLLEMRKIAECLIRANACSFILAHNHTGTNAEPSDADLVATKLVSETFARLGIPLREHYVVSGRSYKRCFSYIPDLYA